MVAGVVGRREDIEDGSQNGEGEAGAVGWGRFNGSGEVLADFGEEFIEVW